MLGFVIGDVYCYAENLMLLLVQKYLVSSGAFDTENVYRVSSLMCTCIKDVCIL